MSTNDTSLLGAVVSLVMFFVLFSGPVGLLVFRKHIFATARGRRASTAMFSLLAVVTAPATVIAVLMVLFGFSQALSSLWSFLRLAW